MSKEDREEENKDEDRTKQQLVNDAGVLRSQGSAFDQAGAANERAEHLKLVLRVLYNVNQLIVREKDRNRLMQRICEIFIENRGYHHAWIALLDESGNLMEVAEAGLSDDFPPMVEQMQRGELTACGKKALAQFEGVVIRDPVAECKDCPLARNYAGRSALTIRLEHNGKIYGLLSVSTPMQLVEDEEEQKLFQEISTDISFSLHNMELEDKHRLTKVTAKVEENRFRNLFSTMSNGVAVYEAVDNGEDFIFRDFNPAAEKIEGVNKEDIIGRRVTEVFPGVKDFGIFKVFQRVWRTGESENFPQAIYRDERDPGTWRENQVYRLPDGKIVAVYDDVTKRKRAEEELKAANQQLDTSNQLLMASEQQLKAANQQLNASNQQLMASEQQLKAANQQLDTSNQQLMASEEETKRHAHDLGERVKELNCLYTIASIVERPGVTIEEILQEAVNVIPPAWHYPGITCARITFGDREFKTENFRKSGWNMTGDIVVKGVRSGTLEVYYLEERPELDEGPFLAEERELLDAVTERLGGTIERKETEETSHQYKHIVSSSTDMQALLDKQFTYLAANKAYLRAFGLSFDQLIGKTVSEVFGEEFFNTIIKPTAVLCMEGIEVNYQDLFDFSDYGRQYMNITYYPYESEDNKIKGFVVNGRNITERWQAEETLKASEIKHKALIENLSDLIIIADKEGINVWNSPAARQYGLEPEDAIGIPIYEYMHPDDLEAFRKLWDECIANPGEKYNSKHRASGTPENPETWIYQDVTFVYLPDVKGINGVVAACRNETEQKKAELNLKKQNEEYASLNEEHKIQNKELMKAKEKAEEGEERFKLAMNATNEGLFDNDLVNDITYYSPAWKHMLGYKSDELKNDFAIWKKLVHPDDFPLAMAKIAETLSNNDKWYQQEFRMKHKNGKWINIYSSANIFYDKNNKAVRVVGTHSDITIRKDAEKELIKAKERAEESRERLESFMNSATESFTLYDSELNLVDINTVSLKKFFPGSKKEEVIGKNLLDISPDLKRSGIWDKYLQVIKTGKPFMEDSFIPHPKFGDLHLSIKTFKVRDGMGMITTDVTERKQAEEEKEAAYQQLSGAEQQLQSANQQLIASEQQLLAANQQLEVNIEQLSKNQYNLLEAQRIAHLGFWDFDLVTGDLFWSDESYRIYGYAPNEFKPTYKKFQKMIYPNDYDFVQKNVDDALENDKRYDLDFRFIRSDGTTGWVHCEGEVTRDEKGRPLRFFGTQLDITKRKMMEQEILESEKKYRGLVEGLDEAIYSMSIPDGKYKYFSPAVKKVFGYSSEEFIENPLLIKKIMHPDFLEYFKEKWAELIEGKVAPTYKFRILDPEGNERWIIQSNTGIFDDSNNIIGIEGICRDITKQMQVEEALRASEEKYRLVAENASDVIWIMNMEQHITYFSPSIEKLRGYTPAEGTQIPLEETLTPESYETAIECMMEELAREGQPGVDPDRSRTMELEQICKDDSIVPTEVTASILRDDNGSPIGFLGITRNITERKLAENTLREREKQLSIVLDNATIHIWAFDGEMYSYLNKSWWDYTGQKPDQPLTIERWTEVVHPDDLDETVKAWMKAWDSKSIYSGYFRLRSAEGNYRLFHSQAIPVYDEKGELLHYQGYNVDITERKKAEGLLTQSENLYRSLVETSTDGIVLTDLNGNYIFCNTMWTKTIGYEKSAEMIGRNGFDFVAPEFQEESIIALQRLQKETSIQGEFEILRKDGSRFPAEYSATMITGEKGNPESIMVLMRDITKRKLAEEELRKSEFYLKKSQEVSNTGSYVYDIVSDDLTATEVLSDMWGIHDNLKKSAKRWISILHPDDRDELSDYLLNHVLKKGNSFNKEYRVINQETKETVWVHGIGELEFDDSGAPILMVGTIQDITERKKTEKALQSEKTLSEEYINSLPGLFYVFDEERFVRWNKEWKTITGYNDEELAVRYGTDFFDGKDRTHIKESMQKVFTDGSAATEAEVITKDGRRIPYYFTGIRCEFNGKNHLVGMGLDITKRKQVEEQRIHLERQVQYAQKLESLGVLAGGIAHDFNNLLMGMLGNADLALSELPSISPARENIKHIETAAMRAAEMARQMLAYSGKGKFVIEDIDLNALIEEMTHLLKVWKSKNVVIKYNFASKLPAVEADATQLRQVVMNLLTNASEASDGKSDVVSISTGVMECDHSYLSATYLDDDLPEGAYVFVEVSDTGCGMDKETMAKIFDPFFTTKFTGRGLGMAAILGIIRGHKGAIKIHSELGKGTTIKVFFPALDHSIAPVDKEGKSTGKTEWTFTGTVLLVDDEEMIRTVGKSMLKKYGIPVLTAKNGRQALEVFKEHEDEITCVVLDLTMPYMDGEETFKELRRIRSDVNVIMSSGYNEQEVTSRLAEKGLAGFIQKPYRREDLMRVLRRAVEGGGGEE